MSVSYWVAAPRGPRAARWERLWAALGVPFRLAGRLEEVLAAEGPRRKGLVLAEVSVLAPRPAAAMAALRARCPRVHVIACACGGEPPQALSAALAAGVLDLMRADDPDAALVSRMTHHLRVLFPREPGPGTLAAARLRIRPSAREAFARHGRGWRPVAGLTAREFDILAVLAASPDAAFPKDALLARLGEGASLEGIDKAVASLRRKLGAAGRALKTVRGRGYLLASR